MRVIEAELQKRLTKAVPHFRSKMCQLLGLRYAPEIRFFKDNSMQIFNQLKDQANQYLEEADKSKANMQKVDPKLIEFRDKLEMLLKLTPE